MSYEYINKGVHAMDSDQAREKKQMGHQRESDFNKIFGDKNSNINYSGSTNDCEITDKELLDTLQKKLNVKSNKVSLKRGNTIQIHLGWIPELTNREHWMAHLTRVNVKNRVCTTSEHGISFSDQIKVLKTFDFWKKYLGKGDILCYSDINNIWLFFNMDDVLNFIIKNIDWRLLETGRIKGDFKGRQILTYEYRPESHKRCFVLGAHGGKKGKEFIDILLKQIPFEKISK
tara:strand:- start:1365 stop:2057 length:693 start_codon:yes stop_codon:yes gene_type:complete